MSFRAPNRLGAEDMVDGSEQGQAVELERRKDLQDLRDVSRQGSSPRVSPSRALLPRTRGSLSR